MVIHRPVNRPRVGGRKAAYLVIQPLAGRIAPLAAEGGLAAGLLAVGLEIGLLLLRRKRRLLRRKCAACDHLADGAVEVIINVTSLKVLRGQAFASRYHAVDLAGSVPADIIQPGIELGVVVAVGNRAAQDHRYSCLRCRPLARRPR